MRLSLYFTVLFVHSFLGIYSQGLRGGELSIDISSTQIASLDLQIYLENQGLDSVTVNWGDGTSNVLIPVNTIIPNSNIYVALFSSSHQYDTLGAFEIEVIDSFLLADVDNISNSSDKYLKIRDSLYIHDFSNDQVGFFSNHNEFSFIDDGALIHSLFSTEFNIYDFVTAEFIPFVDDGYTLPIADSLEVGVNGFYWSSPQDAGTYAFAIRLHEFRWNNNFTEYLKLGTKTRYMMIDIDSSMLVSNHNLIFQEKHVTIYPNPVKNYLNIKLVNALLQKNLQLQVTNLLGQSIFQQDIPVFEKEWTHQLDVSSFPSGTYFLTLQNGGGIVSRKFMVQH